MKKVLFFAAVLAVASMTFVACGKKENKEAEQEATEQIEAPEVDEEDAAPAAPAADVDRAEAAVRALEAAQTAEECYAIEQEYSDVKAEDFTPEQMARIAAVAAKLGLQ
jgi:hypothetical protein